MTAVPASLGCRLQAEWEPHEATWITWPQRPHDWPGKFPPVPWVYTEIVRQLRHSEKVNILVDSPAEENKARRLLRQTGVDLSGVVFFPIPTNRVWIRDYGPLFLLGAQGELCLTNWQFNAWSKYPDWELDNAVPTRLAKALGLASWAPRVGKRAVVLEGGSIDVNGQGLLLTTEECLLSPVQERNPGLSRTDLESVLGDYLCTRKVLWLGKGLVGDDTNGHVDTVARFVGPHTIVAAVEDNSNDANYQPLRENWERLQGLTDVDGRRLEIVKLPMPEPLFFKGQRLPATYANFYIANDRVLVPTFNDPQDRLALGILAELFLEREIVGVHAVDLVWGLGTLHCLTQQQPRAAQRAKDKGRRPKSPAKEKG